ncbi:MAG: hypothetical protein V1915_04840 [Candidatus Bathyarchaeota archaeon]
MAKIYLAVPIIANRDLKKALFFSQIFLAHGHEIISKWVLSEDPGLAISPSELFLRDVSGVKNCDILVAEISDRSHGVGMEIMLAYLSGKKIMCFFRKGTHISRLILGIPNATFIEYSSENEVIEKLKKW